MKSAGIIVLFLAVAMGFSGCASDPMAEERAAQRDLARQGIAFISATELLAKMHSQNPPMIVDVLSPSSYDRAHIEGAINIPYAQLWSQAAQYLPDKSAEIVVYCASYHCEASTKAAKTLMQMGYTNVLDYKGGITEWTAKGYPAGSK